MSWANEKIAHPMGYAHAALFPRARDALTAFERVSPIEFHFPSNICPAAYESVQNRHTVPVNDETGLAPRRGVMIVQLYGYRQSDHTLLELDPLMTGWGRKPCCESSIVSFGLKKFISIGHGGAFLTNNLNLASEMAEHAWWPLDEGGEASIVLGYNLGRFLEMKRARFDQIARWDAALGDLLPRIPMEQVIPWRVMRRVPDGKRDAVVSGLRQVGIPVGTNYPPLTGSNKWGDEVINFFPECERAEEAALIIEGLLHG